MTLRERGLANTARSSEKEEGKPKNQGKLILDATCAPGDISYPSFGQKNVEQILFKLEIFGESS